MKTPYKNMKKEELQKRIGELERQLEDRVNYNERVRREFAKAFGWGKKKSYMGSYSAETEWSFPSWEQIFVKTGKLLNDENIVYTQSAIKNLGSAYAKLEKRITGIEEEKIKDLKSKL